MIWKIIAIAAACCGVFNILADEQGRKTAKYVSKPLTMLLVLMLLAFGGPAHSPRYSWILGAGLLASLAGDVFLMLEEDYFIQGLVSFLIAHILYIVAFSLACPWSLSDWPWLLPFVVIAGAILTLLWPHLKDKLKIPVVIYVAAIVVMVWRAGVRFEAQLFDAGSALLVFVGACLFLVSDAVLSIRRFVKAFPGSQVIVLGTYFSSQICLALSALKLVP